MNDRVRSLALDVRSERPWDGTLRTRAEGFAAAVLRRAAERLHAAHPDRVLFVRKLAMRWRIVEDAMGWAGEVDAFASEVEAHLEAMARDATRPRPDADVALFADESAWRAAYVLEGPKDAWYFADLAPHGEDPAVLAIDRPTVMERVARALVADERALVAALARMSDAALRAWIDRLAPFAPASGDVTGSAERPPRVSTREAERRALIDDVVGRLRAVAPRVDGAGAPGANALRETRPATPRVGAVYSDRPGASRVAPKEERSRRVGAAAPAVATRFAAATYLASSALELDLGRTVFEAGPREGAVFGSALAAAAAVEPDADPIFGVLGGIDGLEVGPVDEETLRAVTLPLFRAVARALARRQADEQARLVLHRMGPLLVATTPTLGAPVFVWPGSNMHDAHDAVRHVVESAPTAIELAAPSPLAELDRTRRVRKTEPLATDPRWFVAADASSVLVGLAAGAMASVFAHRLGARDLTRDALAARLAVEGTIREDDDAVVITMPAEAIALDVRRAGLDRSPGWVPWLDRRVEISFAGGEEL